jgi:cysteine synthase A
MRFKSNMLDLIGNTPLLKLQKVTKGIGASVYVKLEHLNPSGSYKDRAALYMIEQAEKRGELKPEGIIIDSTTGNFGPALAFVGGVKGYKVQLIISELFLPNRGRLNIMKSWGAEAVVCPPPSKELLDNVSEGEQGLVHWVACKQHCSKLRDSDPRVWWADQITNPDNPGAHRIFTGSEVVEQTGGDVDIWVASVGSAGTLWGVADALKEKNPELKVVAAYPDDFPLFDWSRDGRWEYWTEKFGFKYPETTVKRMLEACPPDEIIAVKDEDARNMANRLAREEGIFCGMSSGANVHAAVELARTLDEGKNVLTIIVERREKYAGEYPSEHYVV